MSLAAISAGDTIAVDPSDPLSSRSPRIWLNCSSTGANYFTNVTYLDSFLYSAEASVVPSSLLGRVSQSVLLLPFSQFAPVDQRYLFDQRSIGPSAGNFGLGTLGGLFPDGYPPEIWIVKGPDQGTIYEPDYNLFGNTYTSLPNDLWSGAVPPFFSFFFFN